jgi:hypothetical protein
VHQVGVFDGDGAQDDAGDPLVQPHLDRGHVADAAAQLRGNIGGREDASTAAPFTGVPAKAPFRSTRCSHWQPAS